MNESQQFNEVGQLNFGQDIYHVVKGAEDHRYYIFEQDSSDGFGFMVVDETFTTITDAFHWLDTNGKFARV